MASRRRRLVSGLINECARLNLDYKFAAVNMVRIHTKSKQNHLVSCASRLPSIDDFYELTCDESSHCDDRYHVLYPHSMMSEERRNLLDWARERRNLTYTSASHLADLVENLKS